MRRDQDLGVSFESVLPALEDHAVAPSIVPILRKWHGRTMGFLPRDDRMVRRFPTGRRMDWRFCILREDALPASNFARMLRYVNSPSSCSLPCNMIQRCTRDLLSSTLPTMLYIFLLSPSSISNNHLFLRTHCNTHCTFRLML